MNTQHEVLLLRRINTPFSNHCYSLPGGKIELGESATQTAIREALDSLGVMLNAQDLRMVHVMSRKCNEPEFITIVFQVMAYEGNLFNRAIDRHDDLQWFAIDRIPKNSVTAHVQAIQMIRNNVLYSEHGW